MNLWMIIGIAHLIVLALVLIIFIIYRFKRTVRKEEINTTELTEPVIDDVDDSEPVIEIKSYDAKSKKKKQEKLLDEPNFDFPQLGGIIAGIIPIVVILVVSTSISTTVGDHISNSTGLTELSGSAAPFFFLPLVVTAFILLTLAFLFGMMRSGGLV